MIVVPNVLSAEEVSQVRTVIDAGEWIDGNATSGHQSALAKRNRQLPEGSASAREAGKLIFDAPWSCRNIRRRGSAAKVYPPLFNRYSSGEAFGSHVDNAVRLARGQ